MQLSTGRRSPRTATSRSRPPQRRNDHDPRTPRKGRLRPGKLQLNPIRCSFHLLPILVYRKGAPVRDLNAAEPQPAGAKYRDTARQAAAKTERHDPHTAEGPSRPGLFILHMVQRSWPCSRNEMLRIRGKQPQRRKNTTSH